MSIAPLRPGSPAGEIVPMEEGIRMAFSRPGWVRSLLWASLAMLVPVAGWWAFCGWCARAFQMGRRGEPGLPGWERPGELLADGIVGFGVLLAWFAVPVGLPVAGMLLLQPALGGSRLFAPLFLAGTVLYLPVLVVALELIPCALARSASRGSLFAAFDLPALLRMARRASRPLVHVLVFYMLSQAVAQFGLLLCGLGLLPALAWNHAVTAWMIGRLDAWYAIAATGDRRSC